MCCSFLPDLEIGMGLLEKQEIRLFIFFLKHTDKNVLHVKTFICLEQN